MSALIRKRSSYLKIARVEAASTWEPNVIQDSDYIGSKLKGPCFKLKSKQSCNISCTHGSKFELASNGSQSYYCEVKINLNLCGSTNVEEHEPKTCDVIQTSNVQKQGFLIKKFLFDIGVIGKSDDEFHPHITVEHRENYGEDSVTVTNCSAQNVQICFFEPRPVELIKNINHTEHHHMKSEADHTGYQNVQVTPPSIQTGLTGHMKSEADHTGYQAPPSIQTGLKGHMKSGADHTGYQNVHVTPPSIQTGLNDVNLQRRQISRGSFSKREWPNLCGLVNLGNTCYMNSTLQCLVHTEPLRNLFLQHYVVWPKWKANKLSYNYDMLVKEMWEGQKPVVNPKELKNAIATKVPRFGNSTQEDAQELMMHLLRGLHDEQNIVEEKQYVDMTGVLNPSDQINLSELAENLWQNYRMKRENSKIFDTFYCQIQEETICSNGHKYLQFQAESQLTLPFPKKKQKRKHSNARSSSDEDMETDQNYTPEHRRKKTVKTQPRNITSCEKMAVDHCTVDKCLKAFICTKEIPDWYCSVCDNCVHGTVVTKIHRLAEIVIIHLKRFHETSSGSWVKSQQMMHFDNNLSITFSEEHTDNIELQNAEYNLYAVINHDGSLTSGHYYAFVKHKDNWFCMNDSSIDCIPKSDLIRKMSNAYVLFYQRSTEMNKTHM